MQNKTTEVQESMGGRAVGLCPQPAMPVCPQHQEQGMRGSQAVGQSTALHLVKLEGTFTGKGARGNAWPAHIWGALLGK